MLKHEAFLWLWFAIGMTFYWLKRAYYLVTGPNPVANTYGQFVQKCWIPLLVRAFINSLFFWALFTPGFVDQGLAQLGWQSYAWAVRGVTQYAAFASAYGFTVDSAMDFLLSKIPVVKDWVPQMPPPLKTAPVVQ